MQRESFVPIFPWSPRRVARAVTITSGGRSPVPTMDRPRAAPVQWSDPVVLNHASSALPRSDNSTTEASSSTSVKRIRTNRARPAREAQKKQRSANKQHAIVQDVRLRQHVDETRLRKLDDARKSAESPHVAKRSTGSTDVLS